MDEHIRLKLTHDEAADLLDCALASAIFQGLGPTVEWAVVVKILKAQLNPLGGSAE